MAMPPLPPADQEERDRVLAYLRAHPTLLDQHPEVDSSKLQEQIAANEEVISLLGEQLDLI